MDISQDKLQALVDYIDLWRQENGIDESSLLTDNQFSKLTSNVISFKLKI